MTLLLDYRCITAITPCGLGYQDAQQEIRWVSFAECAAHYQEQQLGTQPADARTALTGTQKTIGWRDAFASPAYIELCSEPRLRIQFPKRWGLWRSHRPFIALQQRIVAAGWITRDLG